MISGWTYPIAFVLSLAALLLGGVYETNIFAYLAIMAFFIWDLYYIVRPDFFSGRDANQLISQVITARTYISYFIPIYGIILSLLFTMKSEQLTAFINMMSRSGIYPALLLAPFLLSAIALLLFPVQMTDRQTNEPTKALKALFIMCFFFEKVIVFVFAHIVFRVSYIAMESM